MAEVLRLTPTASVEVLSETPEALVVEATYTEGHGAPPAHLHPSQDERFEVLEGAMHAAVGGEEHLLRAGAVLEVPRCTPHAMWVAEAPARVRWETRPAGRTAEWFRALDALGRQRAGGDAYAALLAQFDDSFRLA